MIKLLKPFAERFLHENDYIALHLVTETILIFSTDTWKKLGDGERHRTLEGMRQTFGIRGIGDGRPYNDPELSALSALIDASLKKYK